MDILLILILLLCYLINIFLMVYLFNRPKPITQQIDNTDYGKIVNLELTLNQLQNKLEFYITENEKLKNQNEKFKREIENIYQAQKEYK